jgi:O-antigen/teichoic acid export membrane protein
VILLSLAASNFLASLIVPDRRLSLVKCHFDRTVCRTLFRFGFPLSISVGLATILMSVDKWLLQALSGPQAVGFFTAAAFVTQVPISSLAAGIGPLAYSMAVRALEFCSPEAARAQLSQNFVVLLGIVVPSAVGIIALSHNLAQLMVGIAYWHSVVLLAPWLAVAAIFSIIRAYYVDTAYQLAHYNSPLIWTTLIAIVINVALDLSLIPNLGELGAAIGSCTALFIGLVVGAVISRGVFRLPLPWSDIAKVVTSSAIMFAILREISMYSGGLALAGQIALGGLVYGSGIIALNVHGMRNRASRRLRCWFRATGP